MSGRPLVVRWGALGDLVVCTPVLRALSERCGAPCDLLASGPWAAGLFDATPFVGDVHVIAQKKPPPWLSPSKRRVMRWLRERGRGPIWVLEDFGGARALIDAAGCPPDTVVDARDRPALEGVPHVVERHWALASLEPSGTSLPPMPTRDELRWQLTPDPAEVERCRDWLRRSHGVADDPLVCIQVGNSKTMRRGARGRASNLKNWPDERWVAVIRAVRRDLPDSTVLLTGAPMEARLTEALVASIGDPAVRSVAAELTIPRLLALLSLSHSLISVDPGPAHVAAGVECPLVPLFGRP